MRPVWLLQRHLYPCKILLFLFVILASKWKLQRIQYHKKPGLIGTTRWWSKYSFFGSFDSKNNFLYWSNSDFEKHYRKHNAGSIRWSQKICRNASGCGKRKRMKIIWVNANNIKNGWFVVKIFWTDPVCMLRYTKLIDVQDVSK